MYQAQTKRKVGKVSKVNQVSQVNKTQSSKSQPAPIKLSLVPPLEGITRNQINRRLAELGQIIERGQKEIHLYNEILNLKNDLRSLPATRATSKGNLLREFLIAHPEGVNYHEINSYLASRGASVSLNFAYNLIHKWGGLVDKKDGKLFWVGEKVAEKVGEKSEKGEKNEKKVVAAA